jgi:hypothetical protein
VAFRCDCIRFFLADIVKGVTGMGLPTVAMGLLGGVMPPAAAAALLRRLWRMMLGIIVGAVAAASILAHGNTRWATVGLGAALIAGDVIARRRAGIARDAARTGDPATGQPRDVSPLVPDFDAGAWR